MSAYQHKYCRIRDEPVDGATGEEVHDGAGVCMPLGNEAALRKLINDLDSGDSGAPGPCTALIRDWGPVQSIRYTGDGGYQGWVTRDILPAFRAGLSRKHRAGTLGHVLVCSTNDSSPMERRNGPRRRDLVRARRAGRAN